MWSGRRTLESYRAFLWRGGSIYDLNSCIPADSGWLLVVANGINDAGQIVGHGILNGTGAINGGGIVNGGHRAFLLNPVSGSIQGLKVRLERTTAANEWRLQLARQPTTNLSFEVSTNLINWTPVAHRNLDGSYLIEGNGGSPVFFRAVFKP
ncbi:MAG: hypothetical protein DME26_08900 [Verrucomicrobia bacterium]|nr:MAG: hypothetical protein DME26_08900 [Verrucomicrobiota bacterium]